MSKCVPINLTSHEMNQFFKRYKLPKYSQGEIDNLNSSICVKDTKFVIYKLTHKENSKSDGFINELTKN